MFEARRPIVKFLLDVVCLLEIATTTPALCSLAYYTVSVPRYLQSSSVIEYPDT